MSVAPEPTLLETLGNYPVGLVLAVYGTLAALFALVVAVLVKSSLRELARRSPSHLTEVVSASVPRPLGAAIFLVEISAGLRWLPLPARLEALTRHLLPFALAILSVTLLMRVARRAIDAFGRSNPALRSTAGLGRAITWVLGLGAIALLASDALGVSLAPVLTALGVGSLAVALALQDTLSNFFSGIYLITDKPFRPGDFVRLEGGGQEGYVEAVGWRSTHLRTLAGALVLIPNATLAKGVLTNFGADNPRLFLRVRIEVGLSAVIDHVLSLIEGEAASLKGLTGVKKDAPLRVLLSPGPSAWTVGFTVLVQIEPTADADEVEHQIKRHVYGRLAGDRIPLAQGAVPPGAPAPTTAGPA